MTQIEFLNVSKKYDEGAVALDNVSFKIDSGEFVFLIGHSGAGKSTVIETLIREELPDSGDILFNGESVLAFSKNQLPQYRRRIGVVFQDFKTLASKTVFENVAIALEVADASEREIKSIVPNVLELVGLSSKKASFPGHLSGGEKQRLSIARALAHEPDVLVADEPTGMIDPVATDEVVKILSKINSLGTTVIMATHDQAIVDKLKKRVIRLENGKVISDKHGGIYE